MGIIDAAGKKILCEQYLTGRNLKAIARDLNKAGYTTQTGKPLCQSAVSGWAREGGCPRRVSKSSKPRKYVTKPPVPVQQSLFTSLGTEDILQILACDLPEKEKLGYLRWRLVNC